MAARYQSYRIDNNIEEFAKRFVGASESKSNFDFSEFFSKRSNSVDEVIKNKANHVKQIEINKRNGKKRKITIAGRNLRYIQQAVFWKFLSKYKEHECAYGFVKGVDIYKNAAAHLGASSCVTIDLKDFFDSIKDGMLKNVLFGNKMICTKCINHERMISGGCSPSLYENKASVFPYVCEEITAMFSRKTEEELGYRSLFRRVIDLVTINGYTPQGFLTSPKLSNIVMKGFDKTINEFCKSVNVRYTRYADDLSFSSSSLNKEELFELVYRKVRDTLRAFGFTINQDKVHKMNKNGNRIEICGLVVNEAVSVPREYRRLTRAKIYNIMKTPEQLTPKIVSKIKGEISFITAANKTHGEKLSVHIPLMEEIAIRNTQTNPAIATEESPDEQDSVSPELFEGHENPDIPDVEETETEGELSPEETN